MVNYKKDWKLYLKTKSCPGSQIFFQVFAEKPLVFPGFSGLSWFSQVFQVKWEPCVAQPGLTGEPWTLTKHIWESCLPSTSKLWWGTGERLKCQMTTFCTSKWVGGGVPPDLLLQDFFWQCSASGNSTDEPKQHPFLWSCDPFVVPTSLGGMKASPKASQNHEKWPSL